MTTETQPLEDIIEMVIFHGHVSFLEGMSIQDLPFVLGLNNYPPRNSSWTHLRPLERRYQQKKWTRSQEGQLYFSY